MKGILGYVAIIFILLFGLGVIYFSQTAPSISKEVTTKEGLLVSSENFNFFILKMLNQSIEFMSQRAAYDLGLNGGFMKNREVYWNYNYPQISDLRKNLENAIGSTLPSFYKKFDKIIELDGAKIIVGEQLRYFDVTGDANFSIYDETVRSRTFTNFKINSRAISSYFRLLDVARQILSDTDYNSSLNDINLLTTKLQIAFFEFNFNITSSGDIVFINIEDKCYRINRNDIYCLAPLHSNELKVLDDASSTLIPYDTLKLNFKIRAAQTGNTPHSCNFSISLNPSSGNVGAGDWVDPNVSLDVAKKGTKRDNVYLTAKAYNNTGGIANSIDVRFKDYDKPMPYSTIMRIGTSSYTPAGNYLINVTGEGCSPYINKFATYDLSVAPSMTFSIFVNPDPVKLNKKNGYTNTTSVSVVWDSGDHKDVDLYEINGLPAGISYKLSKNKMPPDFTSILTLNITDKNSVNLGDYNIKIKAIGGGSSVEKQFTLHIDPSSICDEFDVEACGGGSCTGTRTCGAFGIWGDCDSKGTLCIDGLFCTDPDACNATGNCTGSLMDCSPNNTLPIAICGNTPDNNPFTFDYLPAFTSTCDEINNKCTEDTNTLTHTCADAKTTDNFPVIGGSVKTCGAQCDQNSDCPNYCAGNTRYYSGSCDLASCTCSYSTEDCTDRNSLPIGPCNIGYCASGNCLKTPIPAGDPPIPAGDCGQTITPCPDKCDAGKEQWWAVQNPMICDKTCKGDGTCDTTCSTGACDYTHIRTCMYNCKNATDCWGGKLCPELTCNGGTGPGCFVGGTSCTTLSQCIREDSTTFPTCTYINSYLPFPPCIIISNTFCGSDEICFPAVISTCCANLNINCIQTSCTLDNTCTYA